jgi:uracil-DNA glycosylase
MISVGTPDLLDRARACRICSNLPLGPRPLFQASPSSKILIAGQAPGSKTHDKGITFDDPSGNRLRDWMGVDRDTFYDSEKIAVLPMGFCYPGTGSSGDLPPRSECAPAWRQAFLDYMSKVELTFIIGRYARDWHLPDRQSETLTETIKDWKALAPDIIPLPHPSPRNNRWLKQNDWFGEEVLPMLRDRVATILA